MALCSALSVHGVWKKSLRLDGAAAAVVLGLLIFTHPDPSFTWILLTFYVTGSAFTKVRLVLDRYIVDVES